MLSAALLAGIPFVAAAQGAMQPSQPSPDSIRIGINRAFATWTATDGPGCAIAVARDGRMVHENGYGMANLETGTPITPASVFHLASVSKQFAAASVLLLAREGKLSLDDDIRKHLPELPDYGHVITIRHLLRHTSGLRDQWDLLAMARGRFEENRITESDVLEIVARQKALNFVPGEEYLYSNTGYTLAGTIVRRVSGKSLRDFAEERIFRPLGMTSTQFQDDYTRIIPNRAAGYTRRPAGGWRVGLPNFDVYGATSLFSNVGDLLKWQANLERPTVGDAALIREMVAYSTLTNGDTTTYGYGLQTQRYRGTPVVGHGGADAGYRTWVGRFPEYALDMAVLCNASTSNPQALAYAAADVFMPRALAGAGPAPMPPRVAVDRALLRALPGVYVNQRTGAGNILSLRGDSTLVGGIANGPEFVPVGPRRFRTAGSPIEYEFMSDGTMREHFVGAWPPRAPATWTRHDRWQPAAPELAPYAGTYSSDELGAIYTVVVRDSTLIISTRWGNDDVFRPVYKDTFTGPFTVSFTRRSGKIDGMSWTTGRVRNVRFVRTK
jgi:CubicO group peptidase (beta-lactamase class C family)